MSEILADVGKRYGQEMESFARGHIVRELCGIQT
tara:strand:- start:224 stop:325 length:102 start_codon:yes stop_codon:yes gene_type:complete